MVDGEWMDIEETALWMRTTPENVQAGIAAGLIPAMTLGDHIRISRTALLESLRLGSRQGLAVLEDAEPARDAGRLNTARALGAAVGFTGLPRPDGMEWIQGPAAAVAFSYQYPTSELAEQYQEAWQCLISLGGERVRVKVGKTTRSIRLADETEDRRGRLVVFFDDYPICEFVEAQNESCWLSLVKTDGQQVLGLTLFAPEEIPHLYRGARLVGWREMTGMGGRGVPHAYALAIPLEDLDSAVHHAAARWLGRKGQKLYPA